MMAKKVFSKNVIIVAFLVLLIVASANAEIRDANATTSKGVKSTHGKVRDVKAIGEEAVRKGVISPPPIDHNFTKIPLGADYKLGQLLVRFIPDANGKSPSIAEKNQILTSLNSGTIRRNYDLVPGLTLVELPQGQTVEDALKKLNKTSGIMYAEPDYKRSAVSTYPYDPFFRDGALWGMTKINAPEAWDITTGSSDIIVAVIDTGVDYNHEDLTDNMWVNEDELNGRSGVDDDYNGYIDDIYGYDFCYNDGDPMDNNGYFSMYHGTHCAGTIGAVGNNGKGVTGVCWNVRIMALRFLNYYGGGWDSDAIECIDYAVEMGADVMSNSWGGGSYNQGLKNTIDAAGTAGVLFVAAAGNPLGFRGNNNDTNPFYPSSYNCGNIIAVMATDENDARSIWPEANKSSAYGLNSVDIGAPGSSIFSCKRGDDYQHLNGTSMATPHVAGACALLLSVDPSLTYSTIIDVLLETVAPTLPGLRCASGGRLNLYNALLDERVHVPWIEVDPQDGTIELGSENVNVEFNAAGLSEGLYEADITILFNDGTTIITVPVDLTVE